MTADPHPKLAVRVIGLAFDQGESAKLTLATAPRVDPSALCCLVLPPQEPFVLHDWWNAEERPALLVLRHAGTNIHEIALDVVRAQRPGPLAVLIDPPRRPWSITDLFQRDTHPLVTALHAARTDIQIRPSSNSWLTRPPRVV